MSTPENGTTAARSRPEGAGAGTGAKLRAAWLMSPNGNAIPVLYKDVNGWAIAEGCVILGRTTALQGVTNAIALSPQNLHDPKVLGNAILGSQYRWPANGQGLYEVPYGIAAPVAQPQRDKILAAIAHWSAKTKIRFRPKLAEEASYVTFVNADYCASSVGQQSGEQQIWLASDCLIGNIVHEMGHTVGLWHEHTRTDRETYVEVVWSNIIPEARPNFVTRVSDGQTLGDYDYASIMHYPADGFAIDAAKPTIITPAGEVIGQRDGLSPGDIAAVAALYP